MTYLEVTDVHKGFGDLAVLQGMNLGVDLHEVVVLIGASGSGKSTLLRCINGLETVDAGEVRIGDLEVTAPEVDIDEVRQRVGIVFQQFNLFPHMTVLDNVTLAPRKVLGTPRPRRRRQRGNCWGGSVCPTRPTTTPTGCPAASSNGWRSCGRWR